MKSILRNYTPEGYQRLFYLIITMLTSIFFAILISLTPPGADDLVFMIPMKGHDAGPGLWQMMIEEMPRIWSTQSGRLGNFMSMPFLYLMPKWVFGIISGILVGILIAVSCRLAGARFGSIVSWLIYATIVLAFPWYDYLTLVTYAINYIWAATAAVAAIFCFLNIQNYRGASLIGGCILMFIAGWIHEGFGAPLCAGVTICMIVGYKHSSKKRILAWFFLCIGTCMTFLSPVFWHRSERASNFLLKFTYHEALMQLGPAFLYILALIFLVACVLLCKAARNKTLHASPLIIFTVAAMASTVVFLKYYTGPRTGAPVILYSALACGYILSTSFRNLPSYVPLQWIIGIIIGGFSTIHLIYADISQRNCIKEYEDVTRLFEASKDGTIYYDLSYPTTDLSLFKTSVRQFHERVPKEFMRMYFAPDKKMVILPTIMKNFTPEKSHKSELSPAAMIYDGWIVLPEDFDVSSFQRIHILTEAGENLPSRFRVDKFYCPDYGYFQLITPHIKVLDNSIRIKDVMLNDHSR